MIQIKPFVFCSSHCSLAAAFWVVFFYYENTFNLIHVIFLTLVVYKDGQCHDITHWFVNTLFNLKPRHHLNLSPVRFETGRFHIGDTLGHRSDTFF